MPRYQATKKVLINGMLFENQITKSRNLEVGEIIDYDPNLKEFHVDGAFGKADLSNLISKGYLVQVASSPIFETSNIGTITASDILFTPTGGIQATNVQDALVETYAESLQAKFIQEELTVTSNGQTQFLLSQTPYSNQSVTLFINAAAYINGIDFTISGDLVTWLNRGFSLTTADEITAAYFVDLG
jgi:hypothetical protein